MDIGYSLDFDEDGNQVDLIEGEGNGNPRKCCMLMLKTWIQSGKGKQPLSWQTLLDIILSLDHKTAHDKVKEYLLNEQRKKLQDSIPTIHPIEATHDSLQSYSPRTSSPSNIDSLQSYQTEPPSLHPLSDHQPAGSSQD